MVLDIFNDKCMYIGWYSRGPRLCWCCFVVGYLFIGMLVCSLLSAFIIHLYKTKVCFGSERINTYLNDNIKLFMIQKNMYSLRLVILRCALGTPGCAMILSSSVINLFLGGSSAANAAARDASSIFRVASSIALDAASMAIASRSAYRSERLLWVGVGGKLSSSPVNIRYEKRSLAFSTSSWIK